MKVITQFVTLRCLFVAAALLGPVASTTTAQISEYQECSDGLDTDSLGENLTAEERIAIMDAQFNAELSDRERCEVADSGANGGGSGAASGAGSDGAGGGGSDSDLQVSPNSLEEGERSLAVSSDMTPSLTRSQAERGSSGPVEPGNNGKEHEALTSADNKKALAESILARAEEEEDPVIKAALMKRYKEITQ